MVSNDQQESFAIQPLYRFLVYLTRDHLLNINLVFCTGSLLTESMIITTVNCIHAFVPVLFYGVYVVLASTHLTELSSVRKITHSYYYPDFNEEEPSYSRDVALAKVSIISNS